MSSCLALSTIRWRSRVKWSKPGKVVAPFPTPWCCSNQKGRLGDTLDYGRHLYLLFTIALLSVKLYICFWNRKYLKKIISYIKLKKWNQDFISTETLAANFEGKYFSDQPTRVQSLLSWQTGKNVEPYRKILLHNQW